jgi:hypothetical protein
MHSLYTHYAFISKGTHTMHSHCALMLCTHIVHSYCALIHAFIAKDRAQRKDDMKKAFSTDNSIVNLQNVLRGAEPKGWEAKAALILGGICTKVHSPCCTLTMLFTHYAVHSPCCTLTMLYSHHAAFTILHSPYCTRHTVRLCLRIFRC